MDNVSLLLCLIVIKLVSSPSIALPNGHSLVEFQFPFREVRHAYVSRLQFWSFIFTTIIIISYVLSNRLFGSLSPYGAKA